MISKILAKIKNFLIFNRFMSYHVIETESFVKKSAGQIEKNSKVLDVGAGSCPYKKYFSDMIYIAQDFCENGYEEMDFSHIDIKSDAHNMPVADCTFDYILCTSVLEHLKYPREAVKEFSRVLRKGGKIFLVVPLTIGVHHEPFDYFRFTKYALKMLAEENGLKVIRINKQGGFFIFVSQTISGLTHFYLKNNKIEKLFYIALYPINFFIAFICYYLNIIDKTKIVLNYECIFEKK